MRQCLMKKWRRIVLIKMMIVKMKLTQRLTKLNKSGEMTIKIRTKIAIKIAILKVMGKTMARIINKIINLKIKKRKHRIILIRKINNNRIIIIINKINRQRSRNQWMTKSLMLMEMIFSFRSSRELNKILRSNKRKRKRIRLMKECLKNKMIK